MTQPSFCDRFAPISVPMSLFYTKENTFLLSHRPDFCADRAVRLVQKLYTLLSYQGLGFLLLLYRCLTTEKFKQNHPGCIRVPIGGGKRPMYVRFQ